MNNYSSAIIFKNEKLGESYERFKHSSGLEIIVFPKKLTTAYAIMGVNCGSINTNAGEKIFPQGVAHFIEHKLFTCEDGSDAFERFSDYGADANAYTSFNKTAYLFSCTDNLEQSLGELVDFVTHPFFTDETVENEKPIIAEEIKMYDDAPTEVCLYGMLEGMYVNNKVKNNICGTERTIAEISAKTLYDFYGEFYRLSNMFLCVCGNVTADQVKRVVDKYLSDIPKSAPAKEYTEPSEPTEVASEYVEKRMQVANPIFSIGFKDNLIPSDTALRYKKDAGMAILNEMLFSRATDFYSSLYERALISSPSLSYGYTISQTFAYNFISGEAEDPRAVLDELCAYLNAATLSQEDFARGKRVMYAEFVKLFDSTESIANTLLSFAGDGAELFSYGDIIEQVSFEYVFELFEELKSMPRTLCSVIPL